VVEQLLGDLDTVTIPGQHFTMEKVLSLLRQEIGAAEARMGPKMGDLQRRGLRGALEDLGHEFERMLPDAVRFVARTRLIAAALALV